MKATNMRVTDRLTGRFFECMGAPVLNNGSGRALKGTIAKFSDDIFVFLNGFGEATCDLLDDATGEVLATMRIAADGGAIILLGE